MFAFREWYRVAGEKGKRGGTKTLIRTGMDEAVGKET